MTMTMLLILVVLLGRWGEDDRRRVGRAVSGSGSVSGARMGYRKGIGEKISQRRLDRLYAVFDVGKGLPHQMGVPLLLVLLLLYSDSVLVVE
jgi:hypothetical protein